MRVAIMPRRLQTNQVAISRSATPNDAADDKFRGVDRGQVVAVLTSEGSSRYSPGREPACADLRRFPHVDLDVDLDLDLDLNVTGLDIFSRASSRMFASGEIVQVQIEVQVEVYVRRWPYVSANRTCAQGCSSLAPVAESQWRFTSAFTRMISLDQRRRIPDNGGAHGAGYCAEDQR